MSLIMIVIRLFIKQKGCLSMDVRVGLIAVEDNMEFIADVLMEYEEISVVKLYHADEEDLPDLMTKHENLVDVWLFSGYSPYKYATKIPTEHPLFYFEYSGSTLFKTLYLLLRDQGLNVDVMSFDTIKVNEMETVFEELKMKFDDSRLIENIDNLDEVVEHHKRLYEQGETVIALTCVWKIQQRLKDLNIPVKRITLAVSSIKATTNLLLRHMELEAFKDTQIAIQMIEIDSLRSKNNFIDTSDELHHMEMQNVSDLLYYSKKINGSLKEIGPGRYAIFSTRGMMKNVTNNFTSKFSFNSAKSLDLDTVISGIGLGKTAYEAETNSLKALYNAKQKGTGSWYVHFQDKKIIGPLSSLELTIIDSEEKKYSEISNRASLSINTIINIARAMKEREENTFTANTMANALGIKPRSARRVLTLLEKADFAIQIGEDQALKQGRPRKKYLIKFE